MRAALLVPLVFGCAMGGAVADSSGPCRPGSRLMARADLFFGAGKTRPADWRQFLATVVTSRFPNGLTSLEATGQWRSPRSLSKETTHVLVLLYQTDTTSDARIEEIRTLYKRRFKQASVLRLDSTACASF